MLSYISCCFNLFICYTENCLHSGLLLNVLQVNKRSKVKEYQFIVIISVFAFCNLKIQKHKFVIDHYGLSDQSKRPRFHHVTILIMSQFSSYYNELVDEFMVLCVISDNN